ncbi:hypothetical protein L1987_14123 [Smallanthus sonchifolius]|uniref:Uncharacterized protein n=1 Tax=Smallanthus sonchifolius TaxID=185202 RepID=A0ACB9J3H0_9ASTR|nr:hypothetical protein L1987_14123 [Smallanthus sonchifolius]
MVSGDSTTTFANLEQNTETGGLIARNRVQRDCNSVPWLPMHKGIQESEGPFQFGNHRKEVDDLHAVIQHFIAANRVVSAIIGHSKGGNCVVLYASLHRDIPIVVNVCGRYNTHMGLEERLGKDYLERAKKDGFFDIKSHTG